MALMTAESTAGPQPLVLFEKEGGIGWLTLNRPHALNAINLAMRDELWEMLTAVRDDPDVGVVILRGAGEQAFCAGADVKEFGSAPSYIAARDARRDRDLWGTMLAFPKPMIAAVHGWALGAGCEMSLYADIRVACDDARFGLPEVNLGYIPSAGGTQTLPRHIPRGIALGMIMTGEPIDAARALRIGLVHTVVPRAGLYDEARRIANLLLRRPAPGIVFAREAARLAGDVPLSQGLALSALLAKRALRGLSDPATAAKLVRWTAAGG
jgi:enoyl-CoA hydratase/carnithine racemase